jgi:hypothetical protein
VVKARSLKGSTFIFSPLGLASGLTQNFKIRLIELARNKRSSLLGLCIIDDEFFYNVDTRLNETATRKNVFVDMDSIDDDDAIFASNVSDVLTSNSTTWINQSQGRML